MFIIANLFKSYGSNMVVGLGTGGFTQNGNGLCNPGDTMFVKGGIYGPARIAFINVHGTPGHPIVIMCQDRANMPVVTGGMTLNNFSYIEVKLFITSGTSFGIFIDGDGGNSGGLINAFDSKIDSITGSNHASGMIKNHNNVPWNFSETDSAHMASWHLRLEDLTCNNCAMIMEGSFGSVGQVGGAPDVWGYDTANRCVINNNTQLGIMFKGIVLRFGSDGCAEYQTTNIGYGGDVGCYMFGGGGGGSMGLTVSNFRCVGPVPCWITRDNCYILNGNLNDSSLFYNIEKMNPSTFGGIYCQVVPGDLVVGHITAGGIAAYNISLGNAPTLNTFWNYVFDYGGGLKFVRGKNLLGFNNAFSGGKTPGTVHFEGGTPPLLLDTAATRYFVSATAAGPLDSVGVFPTFRPQQGSPCVGIGVATPYTTDITGKPWNTPRSIGPYEINTAISYIPGLKKRGRVFLNVSTGSSASFNGDFNNDF